MTLVYYTQAWLSLNMYGRHGYSGRILEGVTEETKILD